MTVLSAQSIRRMGLLTPCLESSRDTQGNSRGMSACGYDLTVDQEIRVEPARASFVNGYLKSSFVLASAAEYFTMPAHVVGVVHDKSSLARRGLAVQNTVVEPGWRGYLTLELTNHGPNEIFLRSGDAVAQVIFHLLDEPTELPYNGKYQDQERGPKEAR